MISVLKKYGNIILVFLTFTSIILFLTQDHDPFQTMVGIALLTITVLVYDIWHEVTYYEEEE